MTKRTASALAALGLLFAARAARADPPSATPPEPAPVTPAAPAESPFSFMRLLSEHGLHDLTDERWSVYGQFTYISSFKMPWSAPYTNADGSNHSLNTNYERSFTGTFTLYFGAKTWPGGEAYFNPEVIAERGFSGLTGIGGSIQNFELQKTGSETPQIYRARLFLRQQIGLGGDDVRVDSAQNQVGTAVKSRRLVLTFGNFTALDVFDKNNVTGDPRRGFLNMAFMTHSSFDFAADARGYSVGLTAELVWDKWAIRAGRMLPPKLPNQLAIDFRFWDVYGDELEIEHDHVIGGQPGAIRLLTYRNRTFSGRFDDAINAFLANPRKNAAACPSTTLSYGSGNFNAPDLCWVRRDNPKLGIGFNAEQFVANDVGLFARGMISDGQEEVDAFDPADADLSIGAMAKGTLWHRPLDVAGVGLGLSFISSIHAKYLAMGGVDGFVGDGHLKPGPETVAEVFYSVNLFRAIWLTGDYQMLVNPGFNTERPGPVHILGLRGHVEL